MLDAGGPGAREADPLWAMVSLFVFPGKDVVKVEVLVVLKKNNSLGRKLTPFSFSYTSAHSKPKNPSISCSALRDFTKNGCSCNADVISEASKLGFSSTMLFATARVAQVACGRGTVFNSCDQSYGC